MQKLGDQVGRYLGIFCSLISDPIPKNIEQYENLESSNSLQASLDTHDSRKVLQSMYETSKPPPINVTVRKSGK